MYGTRLRKQILKEKRLMFDGFISFSKLDSKYFIKT